MQLFDPAISERDIRNVRPILDHGGLSGAQLFQAELHNGTRVVLKRSHSQGDLFQRLLGHKANLELLLWQEGVFDQLPSNVGSPTIGGWVDGDTTTIVMRDLGAAIIGPGHAFDAREIDRLLRRLDSLHQSGIRPVSRTKLRDVVGMFSTSRVASVEPSATILRDIDRGWAAFARLAPIDISEPVMRLARDPMPLVAALAKVTSGFCHGDVAGVNMAWEGDRLVLLDWGQAFVGPPALDIARFLPSGLRDSAIDNDWLIERYRRIAGGRFDPVALELSLLATFIWYGWQKSIDATETKDQRVREVELAGVNWWLSRLPAGLRALG